MRTIAVASCLLGMALMGCAKLWGPTALSEPELLELLAKAEHQGPMQFRHKTWPLLENKSITYCGYIDTLRVTNGHALVQVAVDKPYAGEELPWTFEAKMDAQDVARSHKPGDAICLNGVIGSFIARAHASRAYWYSGYIKDASLEKQQAS